MALTTAGRDWVIDMIQALAPLSNATQSFIGWGTGTNAEAVGDTQLQTEASETRVTGTLSQPTAETDRLVGTITANGTKTISEVGRFNKVDNGSGRQMQQRHVFTGIPLLVNDQITFTLDLLD
jgi:hypothetical protein